MRLFIYIMLGVLAAGCSRGADIDRRLDNAASLLESAPDSSLKILERIYQSVAPDDMGARKARTVMLLAEARLRNGGSFLTVDGFDDALNYYEAVRDTSALLTLYQLAAIKSRWLGNQERASSYLSKAIDLASDSTFPTRSALLIELSNLYAMPSLKKDYASAVSYAREALKEARTIGEKARALHDIGLFYSFCGMNDSTVTYMEKALDETDVENPEFTQYALNYANTPSADFDKSVSYLAQIKSQSLGKLITLGFMHLNHAKADSARHYLKESQRLYYEDPPRYSINTYNNLQLLEQSIGLHDKGIVLPIEGNSTNDSLSEVASIRRKISDERRDYNNKLQMQLLQTKADRQILLNVGLGILLILSIGFGFYVWYAKRKFLKLKQRLDKVKIEQIVAEATDGATDKSLGLVRMRIDLCIEQFRASRLQAEFDKFAMKYRNTGGYPSLKEREASQKILIGCFADFIVDLKMTGAKLTVEDIVTCLMSCLRETNVTIAACLGVTDTAVRTRKSRLRTKLPAEMLTLLDL